MTKIKKISLVLILILALIGAYFIFNAPIKNVELNEKNNNFKIVTTFYPVELIIKNITAGAQKIDITNITQNMNGCIHDYQLTPNDVKTIENSDVVIINGADMEHFIEGIENIKIIDSSKNIKNVEKSSHIWMNIDNYIKQVEYITENLCVLNPENKDTYIENKEMYLKKINEVKERYNKLETTDVNIAIMHDSFEYYADDNKFKISARLESGHEENISANEIKSFIQDIKNTNTKVVLVDSETNSENTELINNILNETNAKVVVIDLIVENVNDINEYINKMTVNIERIKEAVNYGK